MPSAMTQVMLNSTAVFGPPVPLHCTWFMRLCLKQLVKIAFICFISLAQDVSTLRWRYLFSHYM